jgi:AraC family transcriptional regulator
VVWVVTSRTSDFGPSPLSVELDKSEFAVMRWCSWRDSGLRSVLLRQFDSHAAADDVRVAATDDQLLVLVVAGHADVESSSNGTRWRHSRHVPGRLAMTAPGREMRLRWRTTSAQVLQTLHLYVPGQAICRVAEQTWARDISADDLPDTLGTTDPIVESIILGLAAAVRGGADDLYAESAMQFLAVHLLTRGGFDPLTVSAAGRGTDPRILRAVVHMHDNLARPLSLADLAEVAQLSPFHFLRLFRATVGEAPHRHLTRLRIAAARRQLERSNAPVSDIAYLCGFSSPAHLAATFRRWIGSSPTTYRQCFRR